MEKRARNRRNREDDPKRFHVNIPLKPQDKPMNLTDDFKTLVHEEYLSRYLEALGVAPSPAAIAKVREQFPRNKVRIVAAWKAQGWKEDTVQVAPKQRHFSRDDWLATPDDILAVAVRKEENAFSELRQKLDEHPDNANPKDTEGIPEGAGAGAGEETAGGLKPGGQRWGGSGPGFMLSTTQQKHERQSTTICLYHFNKAHAFIRYTKDRQVKKQTSEQENIAAAVGAVGLASMAAPMSPCRLLGEGEPSGEGLSHSLQSLQSRSPRMGRSGGSRGAGGSGDNEIPTDAQLLLTQDGRECLDEVKKPLSTSDLKIIQLQNEFLEHLPLEKLSIYDASEKKEAKSAAQRYLTSHQLCQLVSLLCHFLYWTLFSEYAVEPLPAESMEKIVLSMQKIHVKINERLRRCKHYTLFHLPVFLDSICFTCQNIFRTYYPKWFDYFGAATDEGIITLVDKVFNATTYLSNSASGPHDSAVIAPFIWPKREKRPASESSQKNSENTRSMRAVHNPNVTERVGNLKLRELFSTTSPLVASIFPTATSMSLPAARSSLGVPTHSSTLKGPPKQKENDLKLQATYNSERVLTAPSRRQLFQLALERVEAQHAKEHPSEHKGSGRKQKSTGRRMLSTGQGIPPPKGFGHAT